MVVDAHPKLCLAGVLSAVIVRGSLRTYNCKYVWGDDFVLQLAVALKEILLVSIEAWEYGIVPE